MKINLSTYPGIIFIFIQLTIVVSCSLPTYTSPLRIEENLKYHVKRNQNIISAAQNASLKPYIYIQTFEDTRNDKTLICESFDDFSKSWIESRTKMVDSVADWVTNAIRLELENEGYKVDIISRHEDNNQIPILISGKIYETLNHAYLLNDSNVLLEIYTIKNGEEIIHNIYRGKNGWNTFTKIWPGCVMPLEVSLRKAIIPFIEDLNKKLALSKYVN